MGTQTLTFEASGGLINASLVMQDKETNTYWAIMQGRAIAGRHAGKTLTTLPTGSKLRWSAWRARHPDTLVLSINGVQHTSNAYRSYFASDKGFDGLQATDKRLPTKALVYAFETAGGIPYAIAQVTAAGGLVERIGAQHYFFYRNHDADDGESTAAFVSRTPVRLVRSAWIAGSCRFTGDGWEAPVDGQGSDCPSRLPGFDTYWYNWSLSNPTTALIRPESPRRP